MQFEYAKVLYKKPKFLIIILPSSNPLSSGVRQQPRCLHLRNCYFDCLLHNPYNPHLNRSYYRPTRTDTYNAHAGTRKDRVVSFYHSLLIAYWRDPGYCHQYGPFLGYMQLPLVLVDINHTIIFSRMWMESQNAMTHLSQESMAKVTIVSD